MRAPRIILALLTLLAPSSGAWEPDHPWTANAGVRNPRVIRDPELGNAQGGAILDGKIYIYGDLNRSDPRIGAIKEYDMNMQPTGRYLRLTRNGVPLLIHPTGLTHDPAFGTFIGNTVRGVSTIYRIDWERAWRDGNLDHAVRNTIVDDAAVNGGRPLFVRVGGRTLLATADYGDRTPELRLYDPARLLEAGRSSAEGVVVHRMPVGPFNQNLHWDPATERLTFVQNVTAGRGWQLDEISLPHAVAAGSIETHGVRTSRRTYLRHNELEGYLRLPGGRELFVISGHEHSVVTGESVAIAPIHSPAGDERYDLGNPPDPDLLDFALLCGRAGGALPAPPPH